MARCSQQNRSSIKYQSWVDLNTGKLKFNEAKATGFKTVRDACPAPPGGKDWQPSAYSPKTGLLYIPHNNLCYESQGTQANYIAGTPYVGMLSRMYAGPGGNRGEFCAWDPVKAKKVWAVKEMFPAWSGALVTAGDVVFYGTMDGWFKALDDRTGNLLWKFKVGSGIIAQPVSYKGPDGKQYIAVLSGVGGWAHFTERMQGRDQRNHERDPAGPEENMLARCGDALHACATGVEPGCGG
jgi:alcohol dehydrogenase (cytochrome c)